MKKFLKILLIIILILITIVLGVYAYLKIGIAIEKNRLEKETSNLMELDNDYKYLVTQITKYTGGGGQTFYEINFENNKVIKKESSYPVLGRRTFFILEEKDELRDLRLTNYGRIISEKELSNSEATELKQLLDDILSNKLERIKNEQSQSQNANISTIINVYISSYKISTKNKTNIEFNNEELINKFLNLVN